MRWLVALVALLGSFGPVGRVVVAQEPEKVPCEQVSVTVSLPIFEVTCKKVPLRSADAFEQDRRKFAKSEGPEKAALMLAYMEAMFPVGAEHVEVSFGARPGTGLGTLVISHANQPHDLGEVDLRQPIVASVAMSDAAFGGKTRLDWLEGGVVEGYQTLLFNRSSRGLIAGRVLLQCFAFAKYGERIGEGKFRSRHLGHYCEGETSWPTPLADSTISLILRALPQLAAADAESAPGAVIAGEFRTNNGRCLDGTASPELRIPACTWLLESGRLPAESVGETLFNRGSVWSGEGEFDRAIEDYTAALRIEPNRSEALTNRGLAWWRKDEGERAIEDFKAALRIKLDLHEILFNEGDAWSDEGEDDRAVEDFTAALRIEPNRPEALANRGLVWWRKGEDDRAIEDFTAALSIKPDYYEALNIRAHVLRRKGEYDRASEDYTAALRIAPNRPEALSNRGLAWSYKGEGERAIEDFTAALSIKNDYAPALANRGLAWKRKGEFDRAIKDFTAALRIKTDYASVLANRGDIWLVKGEFDRAIEDFTAALRIAPDYFLALNRLPTALNHLAWLLATASDARLRDGARAVTLAEKAVSLRDTAANRDTLAAAYAEASRFDDAVSAQERAISMERMGGRGGPLIAELEDRLRLYRQGQPYREQR